MKVVVNIAVRLVAVLLLLATGFAQPSEAPFSITIMPSSDGISAGTSDVRAGADVRLIVTLTNLSNREITFQFTSPMCDYTVEVHDIAIGKPAADTGYKRTVNCAKRMTGRNIYKVVKPNESTKDWINVSLMSDMSQLGEYSVQVRRKTPKEFGDLVVESNTIYITVIP